MAKYGLVGKSLSHSFSVRIHQELGCKDYCLYETSESSLVGFFKSEKFDGVNVTIPYKKVVASVVTDVSPAAKAIGNVNTVIRRENGALYGENTDYLGFAALLDRFGIAAEGKKVLVLGSGGSAMAVKYVLSGRGAKEIVIISRRGENNYNNLERHRDADMIVNATPVGMYPNVGKAPLDVRQFPSLQCVIDLIYNPHRTRFLLDAEEMGVPAYDGLYMLVAQAKAAEERFRSETIPDSETERVFQRITQETRNITLIGMPGVGKTSCGVELSRLTGRRLVDIDDEIEQQVGCSIPDLLASRGEHAFRRLETSVLADCAKQSGLIIATGGGVVTQLRNKPLIRQNSYVILLRRPGCELETEGRPISAQKGIFALEAERMPAYLSWADIVIDAVSPAADAKQILEALKL